MPEYAKMPTVSSETCPGNNIIANCPVTRTVPCKACKAAEELMAVSLHQENGRVIFEVFIFGKDIFEVFIFGKDIFEVLVFGNHIFGVYVFVKFVFQDLCLWMLIFDILHDSFGSLSQKVGLSYFKVFGCLSGAICST